MVEHGGPRPSVFKRPQEDFDSKVHMVNPDAEVVRAPTVMLYHRQRDLASSVVAVVSFVTGVVLLWTYTAGTIAAYESLVGSSGGVDGTVNVYSDYKSYSILPFLADVKASPDGVLARLAAAGFADTSVVYIEAQEPSDTDLSTYAFTSSICAGIDGGKLAQVFSAPVVERYIAKLWGGMSPSTWSQDWRILVDCTFEGITSVDASSFRVYIVDVDLSFLATVTSQVMNIVRPTLRQFSSCTVALVVNSTMASIAPSPTAELPFTRALEAPDDVLSMVAIDYPFESARPFERFVFDRIDTTSVTNAKLVSRLNNSPDERVMFVGFDGSFRDAASVTGQYYSYSLKRPTDAVEDMAGIQYLGVPVSKNGWAWGHILVGASAVAMLAYALLCGLLTCYYSFKRLRYDPLYTLPDISRRLTSAITIHAAGSVVACVLDGGWALFQWADVSMKRRKQYSAVNPHMVHHARSMLFSWVIALALATAVTARTNVPLSMVVMVLVVADAMWVVLNSPPFSLFGDSTEAFYDTNQQECLVHTPGDDNMDLWTYHPLIEWNAAFVANEVSCFVWAYVVIASIIVGLKGTALLEKLRPKVTPDDTNDDPIDGVFGHETNGESFGLWPAFGKHKVHRNLVYTSSAWLWDLGYVVVAKEWLFRLDDLPKLLCNVLSREERFYVYGHRVDGNIVQPGLVHVLEEELRVSDLWRLSLLPVRYLEPTSINLSTKRRTSVE